MTSAVELVPRQPAPVAPLDLTAWTDWLQEHIDPQWRPGGWSQPAWFFDSDADNPRTAASKCITTSCWTLLPARGLFCRHCLEAHKSSDLGREEFAASYARPRRIRSQWGSEREPCVLERSSGRCERPTYTLGLCRTHYSRWRRRTDQDVPIEEWLATTTAGPLKAKPTCIVRGCRNQRVISGLCNPHLQSWDRDKRLTGATRDPEKWAQQAAPHLLTNQFCLRRLEEAVRWEFLYGLQQRDARGGMIEPQAARQLASRLAGVPSLLAVDPETFVEGVTTNNLVSLFREIVRALQRASLSFRDLAPMDVDTWDLGWMDLKSSAFGGRRQRPGKVDAAAIRQPWFREVIKTWASTASLDSNKFTRCSTPASSPPTLCMPSQGAARTTRHCGSPTCRPSSPR